MKESRTTLVYKGVEYPFYITNRGKFDFENAGFSNADIAKGSFAAQLALVYFNLRDCAKRANLKFDDSFEQFIDESDQDVIQVFLRLQDAKNEEKAAGKAEAKAEAEENKGNLYPRDLPAEPK